MFELTFTNALGKKYCRSHQTLESAAQEAGKWVSPEVQRWLAGTAE